jgi:hypothetical protein
VLPPDILKLADPNVEGSIFRMTLILADIVLVLSRAITSDLAAVDRQQFHAAVKEMYT